MKLKKWFSTRPMLVLAGLAGVVSACATIAPTAGMLAPLDRALASDLPLLREQAEAGDAEAQLAMSIVAAHGLRGRVSDAGEASFWLRRALANRRIMPITQYTAAFNGNPSRVNIIHTPVAVIQPGQVAAIDRCIDVLRGGTGAPGACGATPGEAEARRVAWSEARRPANGQVP